MQSQVFREDPSRHPVLSSVLYAARIQFYLAGTVAFLHYYFTG